MYLGVQDISMGEPGETSTPRNPPIIMPKPAPQRQDLSIQGRTLNLESSLDSTAPELNSSRGLSRQDAFDEALDEETEQPSANASAAEIVEAIGENTLAVSRFIGELADRVKKLETSVNKED